MMKILIDTNRYLDLYESDEDTEDILGDMLKFTDHLIFPDIILDEFLRNRTRILDRRIKQVADTEVPPIRWPFFLRRYPGVSTLQQKAEEYNQAVSSVVADLEKVASDIENDPIYRFLLRIYRDPGVMVLHRTDELIERAHRRKLIGNPPKSEATSTIGDELIWETVLESLNDDLILITRDYTYRNHAAFLVTEYRERTGKVLTITEYISVALERMRIPPGEALLRFEGRMGSNTG
ncbi:MAG: DUF4935 domain-containing protein [Methanomicrobiaceae archaeon]|nr:DUF4935 domain-containing protein [Methanomicrobiaceae archaeon]